MNSSLIAAQTNDVALFPRQFNNRVHIILRQELDKLKLGYEKRESLINQMKIEYPVEKKLDEDDPLAAMFFMCGPMLTFYGTIELASRFTEEYSVMTTTAIFVTLCVMIIFDQIRAKYDLAIRGRVNLAIKASKNKYEYDNEKKKNRILNEHIKYEEQKLILYEEARKIMSEYNLKFENAVMQYTEKFSKSPSTARIVDWLTDIAVDNIKNVKVDITKPVTELTWTVEVYTDKVICNSKIYDFQLPPYSVGREYSRVESLTLPVEQAALCRVLARSLQINLMHAGLRGEISSKKPVEVNFEYEDTAAAAQLKYAEINTKFVPKKAW